MRRTTRLPAAQRRQQLLDVAATEFGESGYTGVSMNRLAEAAGVTKPVLYRHFSSKHDLYLELMRHSGRQLHHALATEARRAQSHEERTRHGLRAMFRFFDENPAAFSLLFGAGIRQDEEFAREAARVEAAIVELVAEAIPYDDAATRTVVAHGMVGQAQGAIRAWMRSGRHVAADEMAGVVSTQAWSGLAAIANS